MRNAITAPLEFGTMNATFTVELIPGAGMLARVSRTDKETGEVTTFLADEAYAYNPHGGSPLEDRVVVFRIGGDFVYRTSYADSRGYTEFPWSDCPNPSHRRPRFASAT